MESVPASRSWNNPWTTKKDPEMAIEEFPPLKSSDDTRTSSQDRFAIGTINILQNFPRESSNLEQVEIMRARSKDRVVRQSQQATLQSLRAWAIAAAQPHNLWRALDVKSWHTRAPRKPQSDKLVSLAKYYFPPRGETRVLIHDFGDGRAEKSEITLGNIEKAMQDKPDWATVRWIHAPLGVGLFHSSVEALFFHGGTMGREFHSAGRAGWPYLETETLNIRSRQDCRDLQDIARLVSNEKDATKTLDKAVFDGDHNKTLRRDIEWRADHLKMEIEFWESVSSDIPWQLSEGASLYMHGPNTRTRTSKVNIDVLSLSKHPAFRDAQLVRNPFRCFHRADGYLLSLSPATGVDYLNKNLPSYLSMPARSVFDDSEASAVSQVFQQFSTSGTDTWHKKSVEWFLVHLMTEIGATPHCIREGYSMPSITEAYDLVVHELKRRRYDPWKRKETITLVRDFLACTDEINTLLMIFKKKLDMYTLLEEDCERFETEDEAHGKEPDHHDGETTIIRVRFVRQLLKDDVDRCQQLIVDLTESLNALFQLRSIEQNELAIISDGQNKAIFVFTGVTIIFLPLSFFASYYGMNLNGITDNSKSEAYFWELYGTIAVLIVVMTGLIAFRKKVYSRIVGTRALPVS